MVIMQMGQMREIIENSGFSRDEFSMELAESLATTIREELAAKFDIKEDYKDYSGLCDKAIWMLAEKIKKVNEEYNLDIEVESFHGEMARKIRFFNPSDWFNEHTWGAIVLSPTTTIYIDPTCQQFQNICSEIPDYYVSTTPPPWFFPDGDNLCWSKPEIFRSVGATSLFFKFIFGKIKMRDTNMRNLRYIWWIFKNGIRDTFKKREKA